MLDRRITLDTAYNLYAEGRKKAKTQKALTSFLREHQFVFVENHLLESLETKLKILPHHERYNFMVVQYSDETYDDFLAFGFKLKGKVPDKVIIYLNYNFLEVWDVPLGVNLKNFRKVKIQFSYNQAMPPKDRRTWKAEHLRLEKNPELKPSKFYKKWLSHVHISEV